MKKRVFSLIFITLFMILSLVGGALVLNADSIFLASTTTSGSGGKDQEVKAQASGNWSDYWSDGNKGQLSWSGTNVYIYDAMDLMDFMCQVNASGEWYTTTDGGTLIRNCNIYLQNDIDMSAHYWTPIGNGNKQFAGTFNGNGHTISGLYIDKNSSELSSYTTAYEGVYGIGLFGVVGSTTISNLTVEGGYFRVYTDASASIRMGAIVGTGTSSAHVNLNNVVSRMSYVEVYNTKATNSAIGGLVGTVFTASINNCFNFAKVEGRSNMTLGGLVGTADRYCDMSGCGNFGEVEGYLTSSSTSGFGGIVGAINEGGSWTILQDCVNYGYVNIHSSSTSYQSSCVGGIIGLGVNSVYVNRCINYGSVRGTKNVGGIAGKMGSPKTTLTILWWTWTLAEARENVLIANCVNYGTITGSTSWGKICGEMNGKENIKGCVITSTGNSDGVGLWQYTDGNNVKTFSFSLSNIDYWNAGHSSNHFRATFFTSEHSYDFTGSQNHYVSGWKNVSVTLNGGLTSGWTITPLIYDYYGGSSFGLISSYPYSLVPSSLIGTGSLYTRYYRNGGSAINFDGDDQDKKVMSVTFNKISGDSVSPVNIGYKNATFYYIKGLSNSVRNSLKFSYNTSYFSTHSASSGTTGVSNPSLSDYSQTLTNGFNRYATLSLSVNNLSSATIYANFQSKLQSVVTKYKIGKSVNGDNKTDAYYDFSYGGTLAASGSTFFSSISRPTATYYYKQEVELRVTPKYGYAVLYVLQKALGDSDTVNNSYLNSDTQVDSRSVATNRPVYTRSSGKISLIKPSVYGKTETRYKFSYGETVIYVVPIQYSFVVKTEGSSVKSSSFLYALQGDRGVNGLSSTSRTMYLSSKYNFSGVENFVEVKNANNNVTHTGYQVKIPNYDSKKYMAYGYTYDLYAYCYSNENKDLSVNESTDGARKVSLTSGSHRQLNTSEELAFNITNMIEKAVQGKDDETRSNTVLHIVVKREMITDYKINFVNLIDGYKSPDSYTSTNGNLGGVSTPASTEKFDVSKTVSYKFDSKYGYMNRGSSYTNSSTFSANGLMQSSQSNVSFEAVLEDYLKNVCNYNVNHSRISSRTLTIYVYYKLQKYNVNYSAVVYDTNGGNTSGPTAAAFTFSSTNSTPLGAARQVYYFAPTTLSVNDVTNANFLGWYLGNGNDEKLLSLSKEYKFLMNPSVIATDGTRSDGGYTINLYAKFARYSFETGTLATTGTSKVIKIKTAYDLMMLSSNVKNGQTYQGYLIQLENDIDMSEIIKPNDTKEKLVFNPIGTVSTPFKGTFDGQNHIISNLKFVGCDVKYRQNLYHLGLFGYTDGATIKNLTIRDSEFNAFGSAGIFVANAKDTVMEHLNNFNSNLTLSKVAFYDVYGSEVITSRSTFEYTTRLVGTKPTELSGVTHEATLYPSARENLAGLVGRMYGSKSKVYACSVNAAISVSDDAGTSYTNGLVGKKEAGTIDQSCVENSENNDSISLTNVANGKMVGVTDSYYRLKKGTNSYDTKYIYNESAVTTTPTDNTKWFTLANGLWTLRVLYWN